MPVFIDPDTGLPGYSFGLTEDTPILAQGGEPIPDPVKPQPPVEEPEGDPEDNDQPSGNPEDDDDDDFEEPEDEPTRNP